MTKPDYRALCAELLEFLERRLTKHYYEYAELTIRARAALAQPEPEGPTEQEWDALVESAWDKYRTVGYHGERFIYEGDFDTALGFVREELARWGRPTPPPQPGEVQELVELMRYEAGGYNPQIGVRHGMFTRAAELLAQRHPQPISVNERLPGPEDCDAEGRCWLRRKYQPEGPTWRLTRPASISTEALRVYYAEWLPAYAMPTP